MADPGSPIIYQWNVPPAWSGTSEAWREYFKIPHGYRVVKNENAECGIYVEVLKNGRWQREAWNAKALIRHLIEELEEERRKNGV